MRSLVAMLTTCSILADEEVRQGLKEWVGKVYAVLWIELISISRTGLLSPNCT